MQIGTLGGVSAVAGVVLAGGRSTRMGRPKANLEWHGSTLLHRVTGIVGRAVDGPVVVVRTARRDVDAGFRTGGVAVLQHATPIESVGPGGATLSDFTVPGS